jgi:hypothetical protein
MAQQWTEWTSNPLHAIKKCIDANQTPEDWEKVKTALTESMDIWEQISPATYLDDVLQEVAGATGIVVQYETVGLNTRYKASYDD